ncbi:phosphatase PAP2 family protein [Pseudarthrobacter sp. P1]|uniref:phosphatase PAP2 family protein n=1 Tax=Pseudarthrobacter sp. P1 TaxID=3418418 RepID=UPI003CEAA5C5
MTSERLTAPPARTRRRPPRGLSAGLPLALGSVLFAAVAVMVGSGSGLALLDPGLHQWLVDARTPAATTVLEAITTVSSPTWLTVIGIGFAAIWALVRREVWRPGLLMAAMASTVAVSWTIKHLLARSRPPTPQMLMGPDDAYSFPSGHTFGATVFLLVLAYLMLSRRSTAWRRRALAAAAVVLIPLVALSRVYLGYHWPTDVLASVFLGTAMLGVVVLVDARRPRWTRVSFPSRSHSSQAR